MITGINHITLAIRNIDKSFTFYHDVTGLIPLVKWDKGAYFTIGPISELKESAFWFCLNVDEKRITNPCYTHYAFTVSEKDFPKMSEKIMKAGCTIFKDNMSPGESLYFLDPDGHKLEIHTGNVVNRIIAKKANSGHWKEIEWF